MSLDDDINRLYQSSPGEFTAARNELAKRATAPSDKARLRALQKPTAPAWAVNQLYWRKRKVFDRLMEAARRLRVEHGRRLSGRSSKVDEAERAHQQALKTAADEVRVLLRAAGETDTPAMMHAVTETLQALPGRDDHGRLTKPLKPLGFEALAGLVPSGGATIARLVEARPPAVQAKAGGAAPGRSAARAEAQSRKREAAERKKMRAATERALREAQVAERQARVEASRTEMALARAQRERKDLQEKIDALTSRRDQLAVELEQRRRDADRATAERERLEALLESQARNSP